MPEGPSRVQAAAASVTRYLPGYRSPDGKMEVEHLEGVPWHDAPLPRRFHRCWPQTRAWMNYFERIERCACGAGRIDGHSWIHKNETRKAQPNGSSPTWQKAGSETSE